MSVRYIAWVLVFISFQSFAGEWKNPFGHQRLLRTEEDILQSELYYESKSYISTPTNDPLAKQHQVRSFDDIQARCLIVTLYSSCADKEDPNFYKPCLYVFGGIVDLKGVTVSNVELDRMPVSIGKLTGRRPGEKGRKVGNHTTPAGHGWVHKIPPEFSLQSKKFEEHPSNWGEALTLTINNGRSRRTRHDWKLWDEDNHQWVDEKINGYDLYIHAFGEELPCLGTAGCIVPKDERFKDLLTLLMLNDPFKKLPIYVLPGTGYSNVRPENGCSYIGF